jgi:hypothetical protein
MEDVPPASIKLRSGILSSGSCDITLEDADSANTENCRPVVAEVDAVLAMLDVSLPIVVGMVMGNMATHCVSFCDAVVWFELTLTFSLLLSIALSGGREMEIPEPLPERDFGASGDLVLTLSAPRLPKVEARGRSEEEPDEDEHMAVTSWATRPTA